VLSADRSNQLGKLLSVAVCFPSRRVLLSEVKLRASIDTRVVDDNGEKIGTVREEQTRVKMPNCALNNERGRSAMLFVDGKEVLCRLLE
jgi:hypothetical protein